MDNNNSYQKGGSDYEPMISKRDLAATLGISPRWIEYRMSEGLPVVRLGRAVRFQRSQVLAWIEAGGAR